MKKKKVHSGPPPRGPQASHIGRNCQWIRTHSYNPAKGRPYWQAELAKKWGVSQSKITKTETNKRRATQEILLKFAELGGKTVDWILTNRKWD